MSKSIALIGNPNCGKTTLFNRLTGARQQIGNWPGVTVEKHQGVYFDAIHKEMVTITDLPGCYSLIASKDMAIDEKIACEYILNTDDLLVNVVDATHLARDLYLSLQLLERGVPVIIAVNCMDLVQHVGLKIDIAALSRFCGCPVIAISAKSGLGIAELQAAVRNASRPNYTFAVPNELQEAVSALQPACNVGEAVQILEGDELLAQKFKPRVQINCQVQLQHVLGCELDVFIALQRQARLKQILCHTLMHVARKQSISQSIDAIVLHKFFGPVIFLGVMYALFTCAINIGGILQLWFEEASENFFVHGLQSWLVQHGAAHWLSNILTEGLGRGISITLTFTPVLATMFFCLGILESSGYMTRAAFIVDRLMCKLGLSGRAFVPMIVGFGCNVPAVMGTRSLTNQRERILTIMMTPFMSCSARLAIYAIFVAAFFPIGGQNIIFSLYVVGIVVAVLTAIMLRNTIATKPESMGIMEMPAYRMPLIGGLMRQVWYRLKSFLVKAGILIIILTVIINGVGSVLLADLGKFLTPLFAPLGISAENWPATVGLITGLIAKEAVVGTLNAFYVDEAAMVVSFGGAIQAYAYLLFTLLYFPCVSVVAAISKELNLKWALFSVAWSTCLAYILAALFFQIATMQSWSTIALLGVILVGFFVMARRLVQIKAGAQRKTVPTMVSINS